MMPVSGIAQQDSTIRQKDSLKQILLNQYQAKITEIQNQRMLDSIRRQELSDELNLLKASDDQKRETLQKQIEELNSRDSQRIAQKKAQIDSIRQEVTGFPVDGFFNDTLFFIYNRLGSFSARDRAEAISERVTGLADDLQFSPDSLHVVTNETSTDILFRESIVMSVTENDGLWNNLSRDSLARQYAGIIREAVRHYRDETSFTTLAKEIALALLVLAIIVLLVIYIGKLFKWTAGKIMEQEGTRLKGITINNYNLLDPLHQVRALLTLNNILKWIFIIVAIYIALPILFGIFPWTENFAGTLFGYVLTPLKSIILKIWNYLPNLITIIVIIFVFVYLLKGLRFLKNEIENGDLRIQGFYSDWARPTFHIVRVLVFAFMIIVIFPYLPGSDSPVFRGVSVFLGFLFTFGSAGSLSNIIAGLILTYMRLFTIGDRVKIGDITGDVIEKSVLVTRIRTIKNEIISIPNSTVMSSHTINYSSEAPGKGLIIYTTITIGYDVPWRDMHQALIDAALRTEFILKDPIPFVLQTSLDDFYVSYQLNAYIREAGKQATIYSDLHQHIQDVCNERGIEIMSSHYTAARDGGRSTIPSSYLPKNYRPPGFNFQMKKERDGEDKSDSTE